MTKIRSRIFKERFKTLKKVNSFISHITNLHKLLDSIMEESKKILNAEASSILLYDPNEKILCFEVAKGKKGEKVKDIKLKLGQGIAGHCAKTKKIINVKDAQKDKRFFSQADEKSHFTTRSILAVPLVRKRKLLGVLEVLNKKCCSSFDKQDIELMKIIADQAAIAIENAYLYRENLKKARLAATAEAMLSLSHDIKNILNGLIGGISILEEDIKTGTVQLECEGWQILKKNIEKISGLMLDMLDFSSKKKPFYQKVNIKSFIHDTVKVYEEKFRQKNCCILYEYDEKPEEVFIDLHGMERVLINLISNGYEAIPEKTGKMILSTKLLPGGKNYQIIVQDNGCGIPRENIKKIFDVFFTTKGHKGTGFGLAVVKKIIHEHKGKIEVESEPGKGTRFVITLPVHPENGTKN
ncbi:MAG: ATP-binding protein [Candidatus Omnitrophica bacterium]|nr:ATP-binding protein [Candidatus Omnitrophota bacterium]